MRIDDDLLWLVHGQASMHLASGAQLALPSHWLSAVQVGAFTKFTRQSMQPLSGMFGEQ